MAISVAKSLLLDVSLRHAMSLLFFFFFQAEDGIRDLTVTGVQTCALPICFCGRSRGSRPPPRPPGPAGGLRRYRAARAAGRQKARHSRSPRPRARCAARSEEHTSELQSQSNLVCRLLLEKKKKHTTSGMWA